MDAKKELKKIKKLYGEKMSHLCRELFPTILETPGLLLELLQENFNEDRQLAYDIINLNLEDSFKDYIFLKKVAKEEKRQENESDTIKTPQELLADVGYDLFECKTGDDIARFKKYYTIKEMLCTFRDGKNGEGRLESYRIFWAVKKDIDQIKRGKIPRREDDYGVSVISIQIPYKSSYGLYIISRYNHTVTNPNATFGNNLDNIVPGLTDSFNKHYNLSINRSSPIKFNLENYINANDGKYYRFNVEEYNIYYCPNNIIIENGEVKKFDKSKYIIFDGYVISKEKPPKIINYFKRNDRKYKDSFIESIGEIEKISEIKKKDEEGEEYLEIVITPKGKDKKNVILCLDKNNNLISYNNENVIKIGNNFLKNSLKTRRVNMPNVRVIGDDVLCQTPDLEELNIPQVLQIGEGSFNNIAKLKELDLPALKKVKGYSFNGAKLIRRINMPNVKKLGEGVLSYIPKIQELNISKTKKKDKSKYIVFINYIILKGKSPRIIRYNKSYEKQLRDPFIASIGKIESVHDSVKINDKGEKYLEIVITPKGKGKKDIILCLDKNNDLISYDNENVTEIGNNFLQYEKKIRRVNMPNVRRIGKHVLCQTPDLEELNISQVTQIGRGSLIDIGKVEELDLPKLKYIGDISFVSVDKLKRINMPNIRKIGERIFCFCSDLQELNMSNVEIIGDHSLAYIPKLEELNLPKLKYIGNYAIRNVSKLRRVNMPNIRKIGQGVFEETPSLQEFNAPIERIPFLLRNEIRNTLKNNEEGREK